MSARGSVDLMTNSKTVSSLYLNMSTNHHICIDNQISIRFIWVIGVVLVIIIVIL